ncbi:MAG: hypothetical protein JO322_05740 [Candidatus Eremiobacteraeota bacterium]|nr:hypothetical protein [Candidatus Eremiobacteraeota bacterium]
MARILLQATIPYTEDDWHIGRFSLLAEELTKAGHLVTTRNREPDARGNDPVLAGLSRDAFDELWLMAVDSGDGLGDEDVKGILNFRDAGGGILTARDHADLGSSLRNLASLGVINHFHSYNPETPDRCVQDDRDNPALGYPNYHSGANGSYQRIDVVEPVHEVLRSDRAPNGVIEFFPAHPHEGAVDIPPEGDHSRVIARGRSEQTGRSFNIAVAIDGEPCSSRGGSQGRALSESTFHHFANINWDVDKGAPSFVTDKPSDEMKKDPSRLEIFKQYVRNIARWLEPSN